MDNQNVDKKNYDIASITRPGKSKRTNYIQDALHVSKEKVESSGKFIRVFADVFLKREAGSKSYF